MSEPAFETDFWKDAELRKTWDDIVPGEPRKTIPYVLTLEAIHRYCRSVGETTRSTSTRPTPAPRLTAGSSHRPRSTSC